MLVIPNLAVKSCDLHSFEAPAFVDYLIAVFYLLDYLGVPLNAISQSSPI